MTSLSICSAPQCICGSTLTLLSEKSCYSTGGVICDLCGATIISNGYVYHCQNGKTSSHPNGYDICLNCQGNNVNMKTSKNRPQTKSEARAKVDSHVSPRDCFIWYANSTKGWTPIPGTGCAHYVAHQKGIKSSSSNKCDLGYAIKVNQVTSGKTQYSISNGSVGDIYTSSDFTHTGIVIGKNQNSVTVRHCNSKKGVVVSYNVQRGHCWR